MKARTMFTVAGGAILLLLFAGVVGAIANRQPLAPQGETAVLAPSISYQGRLTSPEGAPLNGTFSMRFIVYDADVGGSALWDSGNRNVTVQDGLFTTDLAVDPAAFNGQALWLSIRVEGETLSPRQEILPAPYALSLRPGADIVGANIGATDAILAGYAPATGTALYADANGGAGLVGRSESSHGVWGVSNEGWGGYFSSVGGYGIRVNSSGSAHYDHGAYITADRGYGVYAQSAYNQAVRGEAGDVSGIAQPLGAVGLVGLGANRGVFAASGSGVGVYGRSNSNYGGYFYSNDYRGIYASSDSGHYAGYFSNRGVSSTEPGIFVDGTIVATGSKAGYVVDVSVNAGSEALERGDVVAVVGISDPVIGEIPVMRVVKATAETAGAVVGVVDQRFVMVEQEGEKLALPDTAVDARGAGAAIEPGEYLSVVTLGAFRTIKADAGSGPIQPGDLLTPSTSAGYAMRAAEPRPGTLIGKALEGLETGQGAIAVYVTMQ